VVQIAKSNERLQRHHGSTGMSGKWNNNYNYPNNDQWQHVGSGQRKSRWEQRWDMDIKKLDAKIEKSNKDLVDKLAKVLSGKGRCEEPQGNTGNNAKAAGKGNGWACPECTLWHTNPTCVKCRACGAPSPKQTYKDKGKVTEQAPGAAGAGAEQVQPETINPMHSPQSFMDHLSLEWAVPDYEDLDSFPADWQAEPSQEQQQEQAQLKAMIALNLRAPQCTMRDKIIADLRSQLLPAKPKSHQDLSDRERVDNKAKLMHMEAEWTQRHAMRKSRAEKAVEEAHKRLQAAQTNLDAKIQEQQERVEEEQACITKLAAVKAHYFQGDEAQPSTFITPQAAAAQVTPQQVQVMTQEVITSINPNAQEFVEEGMSADQVMKVTKAVMQQMIVMQQQKHAQAIIA
jgi:hypothetical protein